MIELRTLDETDAVAFRAIWLRALREHPEAFGAAWEEEQQTAEEIATRLRTEATPESFTLGAFAGQTLVGIVSFRRWTQVKLRHSSSLSGMYVAPEVRGQGVGRMLIAEVVARARRLPGVQRIRLAVTATNVTARALYESLGFESFGIEPQQLLVDGQGYDVDWMVLSLHPAGQHEEE